MIGILSYSKKNTSLKYVTFFMSMELIYILQVVNKE